MFQFSYCKPQDGYKYIQLNVAILPRSFERNDAKYDAIR